MTIKINNGNIITGHRILENANLLIRDGEIVQISTTPIVDAADQVINAAGLYVSPGFIDMHLHGGGGSDFMDGTVADFLKVAETHLKYGTTAMFPTTLTAGKEDLLNTLDVCRTAMKENKSGAGLMGMHIEGPYFSIQQRGAQDPRYIRKPDPVEYTDIVEKEGDIIARWSAAPEIEGAMAFGRYMVDHDILPAIAHTDAIYEDVVDAVENGFTLATHFYSSMSGVMRKNAMRFAGVIESVYLMDEIDVEIIADGIHLPAPLLKLIYKIKGVDRIALITDAMRASGTTAKESLLGSRSDGLKVIIEDGVAKLPDRSSFAGSVATADRLVRNIIQLGGVSLVEAIRMMTINPARIMGIQKKKGSIAIGKDADLVLFDEQIQVKSVFIGGNLLYEHHG